ncbi:hypothetical protein RI129_009702 [Pyrocoelia pectoralis]|uniref:Uncharacterized protein n=1 Tax=Pyrocoelia pectoralis TaxID=417401 RepID=A0AAN7V2T2_9COLE
MNYIVLCLVLLCCVSQLFSFEVPDELIDTKTQECLSELNFDKKIVSKYVDEKLRIINLDEDGIKLMKCSIKKGNYYTPDGEFNREAIIEELAKTIHYYVHHEMKDKVAVATQLYDKCNTRNGKDQVEELTNLNNCIVNEAQKV